MQDLTGRVAIVTGSSRGIGRAIAIRLARDSVLVAAVARSRADLEALAGECPGISPYTCDVTDEPQVEAVVRGVVSRHGRIDILVNNAGVGAFGPLEETTYADFQRLLAVNAGGTFLFTRAALPHMKERGQGDIVNVASVVAHKGYPRQSAYTASKHAVLGLTKAVAAEAHPFGVRVRAVSPGGVDTDLVAKARPDLDRSELIRPEDIAEIVLFLLKLPRTAVIDQVNVRRAGAEPWY
jgi:3-oxoacyl-[acyl-carrier protein] reductase